MAEASASYSPYAYVANNPLRFIDPNGMYKVKADSSLFIDEPDEIASFMNYMNGNSGASINDAANYIFNSDDFMQQIDLPEVRVNASSSNWQNKFYNDVYAGYEAARPNNSFGGGVNVANQKGSGNQTTPAWYDFGSKASAAYGFAALAAPLIKSSVAYTKGGALFFKYYSSGWTGGSRALISTVRTAEVIPFIGFAIGLTLDGVALSNNNIGLGKFSLNTTMGAFGLTGVGTAPSLLYFGIDNFYKGGINGYLKDNGNAIYQIHKMDSNYSGPTFSF